MSNPVDERLLGLTAIVTIAYQFVFFMITYLLRFDKVTDFAGSTNFMLLAVLTLVLGGGYSARQVVLTSCVLLWGLRLCAFLLYRILLWGEDRRFDEQRRNIVRLIIFWTLQAFWCWTVSLPLTILNSKSDAVLSADDVPARLQTLDYIGWAIFACGLVIEAVADQQKLFYKQRPESKGRWTDVGLWYWSRHPNFFGELLVWYGLYLSAVNGMRGAEHAAVVSPVFITCLLLFVSGIPILERNADKRYAHLPEYETYKRRTSVLVLAPPALYDRLPQAVKSTLLLDFPLYNPGPAAREEGGQTRRSTAAAATGNQIDANEMPPPTETSLLMEPGAAGTATTSSATVTGPTSANDMV